MQQQHTSLNSEHVESLAYKAMNDLNFATRRLAEEAWIDLVMNLPLQYYKEMMETRSQIVLLAMGTVLRQNIALLNSSITQLTNIVNGIFSSWHQPNGSFARSLGELEIYVVNTFGDLLGVCLKELFVGEEGDWVIGFLTREKNPQYRLFLFARFIGIVSIIDNKLGFVHYREVTSRFQEQIVPLILKGLIPYFIGIHDEMEMNELAFMQGSLSLREEFQPEFKLQIVGENRFTDMVFKLLEDVLQFKYNINFTEYNDLTDYENMMISFPDDVIRSIMEKDFLESLYSVIIKLMRIGQKHRHLQTCLNCLKKILLAKTTYLAPLLRCRFVFVNMEGTLRLMELLYSNKITNLDTAIAVIQCSVNLADILGVEEIRKTALDQKSQRHLTFLNQWLELVRKVPLKVLRESGLPISNELLKQCLNLMYEIGIEQRVNGVNDEQQRYYLNYQQFTQQYLRQLIESGADLFSAIQDITFEQFKKHSDAMFKKAKIIATYNYCETFSILKEYSQICYTKQVTEQSIGNLILFLRALVLDDYVLEQGIFGNEVVKQVSATLTGGTITQPRSLELFGLVLAYSINFICKYIQTPLLNRYINNAIVVFLETYLNKCIRSLQVINDSMRQATPKIGYYVHCAVRQFLECKDDEQFILVGLNAILTLTAAPDMPNIEYLFETIHDFVVSLKKGMDFQNFHKTKIYNDINDEFKRFIKRPMPENVVKWRSIFFKTITVLNFEHVLDSYKSNIEMAMELLEQSSRVEPKSRLLYELIGIFDAIQGQSIYRYFLTTFLRRISLPILLDELFKFSMTSPNLYLKDALHLTYLFITNRSDRFVNCKAISRIYDVLGHLLPYWNNFFMAFSNEENDADNYLLFEELYLIVQTLIKGQHINICLAQYTFGQQFSNFFRLAIRNMAFMINFIEQSPQFAAKMFDAINALLGALKPLFGFKNTEVGSSLIYLMNCIMNKIVINYENIAAQAFGNKLLDPMLQIVENYLAFIMNHRKLVHLGYLMSTFGLILSDLNEKPAFFETILKLGMDFKIYYNEKLDIISNICVRLVRLYELDFVAIVDGLGIKERRDRGEIVRIIEHIKLEREDFTWLSIQFKDWFKLRQKYINHSEYDY